ncbi:unnamed protein product [Arctogadus glacialis]
MDKMRSNREPTVGPSLLLLPPPSLGNGDNKLARFGLGPGPTEEDTWTALRVSAWSSQGPLLPPVPFQRWRKPPLCQHLSLEEIG